MTLMSPTNRRTNMERVAAIFEFIAAQNGVFPKSRLKEIGLSPTAAESWLEIIEFVQAQPKIRLIKTGHTLLVEKVEGKYQVFMRNKLTDESIPIEQRLQFGDSYLRSLYTRERTGVGKAPHNPYRIDGHITGQAFILKLKEASETLGRLSPAFQELASEITRVLELEDEDQVERAFAQVFKAFLKAHKLPSLMAQITDPAYVTRRTREISKSDSGFKHKFDEAMKFLQAQLDL